MGEYQDMSKPAVREKIATALQYLAELSKTHGDVSAARAFNKASYYLADPAFQPRWSAGDLLVPSGSRSSTVIHRTKMQHCSCEADEHGASCWHLALMEGYGLAFDGIVPEKISQVLETAASEPQLVYEALQVRRPETMKIAPNRGTRVPETVLAEAGELFGDA